MLLSPTLRRAWLIAALIPVALLGATPPQFPPETFIRHLPETNPYRPVLTSLLSASAEDQDALRAWFNSNENAGAAPATPSVPLTAAQQALARELTESLTRAASAPPTAASDWPLQFPPEDPDHLYAGNLPEIGSLRLLAKIATRTADALPAPQSIRIYGAVGQLARQQRNGLFIIQQLTGSAIEETAMAAVSRRLGELDADGLQDLARSWSELTPFTDPRRALENERDVGCTWFVEAVLHPALLEILSPESPSADTADPTTTDATPATFTRDLRLSGLIDLGGGERLISLENIVTGEHFTVSALQPAHGIRLLHIDFERHEAIIRRGRREAVIHLESKQITERRFIPVREPAKQLEEALRNTTPDWDKKRAVWLNRIRNHPGGIAGYLEDLTTLNDRYYEQAFASAAQAQAPATPTSPAALEDPALALITPAIGGVLRKLHGSITAAETLQAAIHHRLSQLGQAPTQPASADPWAESPGTGFVNESTPDGGFVLRSLYEFRPGAPLTYKFAAPDAGLVGNYGKK